MLRKTSALLPMVAILLIPILLGMTPMNMAHKLASGSPFNHCKQVQLSNHCPFHSLISHNDPTLVNLTSTLWDQEASPIFSMQVSDSDPTLSNITFGSIPLRC